ncbi:MAG: hypothetical protein M3Z01_09325 [Thermoproteota archaeon]|nr:hypothetical protein [Thermoproteota archaeon]
MQNLHIEVCPVKLYQWYITDNDVHAVDLANSKSSRNCSDEIIFYNPIYLY